MITERTLRKWRKEALVCRNSIKDNPHTERTVELCERILRMTQELLDQHLIWKETR